MPWKISQRLLSYEHDPAFFFFFFERDPNRAIFLAISEHQTRIYLYFHFFFFLPQKTEDEDNVEGDGYDSEYSEQGSEDEWEKPTLPPIEFPLYDPPYIDYDSYFDGFEEDGVV